jgi:hypothetical protein
MLCHKHKCQSRWRLCPSCVSQGDVSRSEHIDNIFSLGSNAIDEDCVFCQFHSDYGATARRSDTNLVKLDNKEMLLPKTELVMIGNLEFKIVPIPLLSDFDYEHHVRVRNIISSGLKKSCSSDAYVLDTEEEATEISVDRLGASIQHFYDINADILSEMEGLYSLEDILMD